MIQKIPITDYHKQDDDILIDLRDNTVFSFGTLTGAVNIPMNDIEKLYALPKDKRIVLFCQQGDYSAEIAELLSDNDYNVADLTGGYREWLVSCALSGVNP
ncbi:MAG: rhodanese-like domain-containing protein [Clostridia bacterium]|nr:rhodanese-like domain-containing protein [Clostridia bacterium]